MFLQKKYIYIILILVIAVLIFVAALFEYEEIVIVSNETTIFSSCIDDLDNDSVDELLLITGKKGGQYGENLVILSFNGEFKEIFRKPFTNMNPWKVQTADVDGDDVKEISIGVVKKAEFHPVMAKRPFIYNWHGDHITPKWRGSRLARPFDDYIFADIDSDGMDEIVSIEILTNGKKVVNSYKWKGFGFEGIGESPVFEDISVIKKSDGKEKEKGYRIYAKVRENNVFEWVVLHYSDGRLIVEKKLKDYVPKTVIN